MKTPGVRILLLAALAGCACSCRLATELMHMEPPRILSYAPSSERPSLADLREARIEFNRPMDKTRTEEAFRLLENDADFPGCFNWEGETLCFRPFAGFRENKTYLMSVSAAAEDRYGNSLAEEFRFRFYTLAERAPPEISGHSPQEYEVVTDPRCPLRLIFSERVDPGSLYRAFTISPPVTGAWTWNAGGSEATYLPLESYRAGEEYRVEVDTALTDVCGNPLAESLVFRFSMQEGPKQAVLSLATGDGRILLAPSDVLSLNQGIEKNDCFLIQLGSPVDPEGTAGFITVRPSLPCRTAWSGDFKACTLCFEEPLEYEGVYELCLLEKVYRLQVTGAASRPPAVLGVTFCNDTGVPLFQELALNQNLTVLDSASACFDFYIQHAADFPIDLGSFLEALSIESGDCLTIVQLSVTRNPAPPQHAAPEPPAGADVDVLRVTCRLEDAAAPPGVIALELDGELRDLNDNRLPQPFLLTVNKL